MREKNLDEKNRDQSHFLAEKFEANRAHLRAVAYRMLGSTGEVDDAVQETWLRLSRSDTSAVENLGGWLTTVVARALALAVIFGGQLRIVLRLTISGDRIAAVEAVADATQIAEFDVEVL